MIKAARSNPVVSVFCLAVLVLTNSLLGGTKQAGAHSPHDTIDALVLSPAYATDQTAFIVIADHLRKSTDGGYSWKELINGLNHKHILTSLAISPSFETDNTLWVSSRGDGIYRSQDGGASWISANRGLNDLNIDLLAISPEKDNPLIFAASNRNGLYKSFDWGKTWKRVLENIKVTAIVFLPSNYSQNILAGDSSGHLYLSMDGGESWKLKNKKSNWGAIQVLACSHTKNGLDHVLIGTEKGGLYKTADAASSYVAISKGLPPKAHIRSIAISPDFEHDQMIFLSTWYEGAYCSTDGGRSWIQCSQGLLTDPQADSAKYRSAHFRDLKISNGFGKDKTIFLAGFEGLFKSKTRGQIWSQMETLPVSLIKGLAVAKASDEHHSIAITTYGGGAYLTHDEGKTWIIRNKGLTTTRLSDIVFTPDDPKQGTIYSASMGYLLRSASDQSGWEKISLTSRTWRRRIRSLMKKLRLPRSWSENILPKSERKRKWPTVITLSPDFQKDNSLFFGTRYHGIFKSDDGGRNISQVWDATGRTISSMAISPDYKNDGLIFAGIRGLGVYKIEENGRSWRSANNGLSFVSDWKNSQTFQQITKKDLKLEISPGFKSDQTVFAGTSEGLYKTTDGGLSWRNISNTAVKKNDYVIGLALSPNYASDQTLLVSLRGKGLYKSVDGGLNFSPTGVDLLRTNHALEYIYFSPQFKVNNTIFSAADEELFKSTDGGRTWQVIKRPVRCENVRDVLDFTGNWQIVKGKHYSASNVSVSDERHAQAILPFVGSGVTWIGSKADNLGIANVYIDGKFVVQVDQFGRHAIVAKQVYSYSGLSAGPHVITIEVSGVKNPESSGHRIEIDALDILP